MKKEKVAQIMSISASCLICMNNGLQFLEKVHIRAHHHQVDVIVGVIRLTIGIELKTNTENKTLSGR